MKKILLIIIFSLCLVIPVTSVKASLPAQTGAPVKPIKILLVPGHDNDVWGAQYGNLKEAAMNLAVATRIYNILKKDKRFEVYITRDQNGYTKEFADYFANHRADIIAFEKGKKQEMQSDIATGDFIQKDNVPHHTVSSDVALRLYSFNKWADDNNIDAMIHVHFDDYVRPSIWTAGIYKGFTIYMPDAQMVNSKESGQLAVNIFTQLHKKYVTSTYPPEAGGLIPDQKLIAMGANDTLLASVRSVLIEYGYISRFGNSASRQKNYDTMASLTVTGIKNYFFGK